MVGFAECGHVRGSKKAPAGCLMVPWQKEGRLLGCGMMARHIMFLMFTLLGVSIEAHMDSTPRIQGRSVLC